VNHLVLSGTATHVLSGTGSSCYRGPKLVLRCWCSTAFRARNFTNLESFGFFLTDHPFCAVEDKRQTIAPGVIAAAPLNGDADGHHTTHALHLTDAEARQPSLQKASRDE
jgi:hypothetical protein